MLAFLAQNGSGSRWRPKDLLVWAALCLLASGSGPAAAPAVAAPSFQEAVNDYNSGNYARALGELEAVKAAYPSNPMVHYYLALSQQAVGHLNQAKAEFQWVISSRDPRLAPMASKGLSQLSGVRTTGMGGSGSLSGSSPPTASAPAGAPKVQGKVKKVLEFWATW